MSRTVALGSLARGARFKLFTGRPYSRMHFALRDGKCDLYSHPLTVGERTAQYVEVRDSLGNVAIFDYDFLIETK